MMVKRVPTAFAGDVQLWTAWLYHVENRTQSDIADELEVSRQTVANYLGEAMERGLVQVQVNKDLLTRHSRALALQEKFGLEAVHVIPTPKSEYQLLERLGRAGGQVIHSLTNNGDTIGVAFGRTVLGIGTNMPESDQPKTKVVQVAGCSIGGSKTSPEICASLIASKLSAQCLNLFAPAYVSTNELATSLLAEPTLLRHFKRFDDVNLLVFGIGELNPDTIFYTNEEYFMNDEMRDTYRALGAVSVIFGRLIDKDGNEIDGPLKRKTLAIELAAAKATPVRLAVAGGSAKIQAVAATIKAGFATHFITDDKTAKRLLKDDI